MRPVVAWVGQVAAWVVIGAALISLTVAVVIPRVAGATPYTVLTGSMRPSLPPGTLVVVKPVDASDIRVGDVITYQLESGKAPVVTHRVTDVRHSVGGDTTFITRGDANEVADADPVMPVQVRGTLWYSVPYLGHANDVLNGKQRQIAVYVVASLLLAYAAFMLTSAARERATRRRGGKDTP